MTNQLDLFGSPPSNNHRCFQREGLNLRYWPEWACDNADTWVKSLSDTVRWKQEQINLFGRTNPLPRLTCWIGDPGCTYTYSGVSNEIEPWSPLLKEIREQVEAVAGCKFNSLLLNQYRNGRDKIDWHADDEQQLDRHAPIASLSLGASRSFRLKPKDSAHIHDEPLQFELCHGDLLVMDPPTQRYWLHQVPQRLRVNKERINLTFRVILKEACRRV